MKDFLPARILGNTHLQTLGNVLIPRAIRAFPSVDRLFELPDGSILVGECSWQSGKGSVPTVLILHGLNGSTISSYVRGTAAKAYAQGFNVIRLNLRNAGQTEKYSRTLCHAGQSDDLLQVIKELIEQDGLSKIGLIAYSFGANICLKAAAEWGEQVPKEIFGPVGVSPLVDLAATTESVDRSAPPIYRWQLLRGRKSVIRIRSRLFPGQYDTLPLGRIKTLRQYDDIYSPKNGFKDADDYYARTSALPLLGLVALPTLLIQADDDMVVPVSSFKEIDNPNIEVIITKGGGHNGFISQSRGTDPDHHWAENRAVEYLLNLANPYRPSN
ncbi:MAG: alpha/beta fold hydrolase [bacterium]|nr:alpha/beta fold hydrolase [bacterium]